MPAAPDQATVTERDAHGVRSPVGGRLAESRRGRSGSGRVLSGGGRRVHGHRRSGRRRTVPAVPDPEPDRLVVPRLWSDPSHAPPAPGRSRHRLASPRLRPDRARGHHRRLGRMVGHDGRPTDTVPARPPEPDDRAVRPRGLRRRPQPPVARLDARLTTAPSAVRGRSPSRRRSSTRGTLPGRHPPPRRGRRP